MGRGWVLAGFALLGGCGLAYVASVAQRSSALYGYLKRRERGWSAQVHQVDASLGYAPRPGVRAAHVFPIGPDVPMRFGEDGFRIPLDQTEGVPPRRPLVLALGCSFTYGDACLAEEAFVHRVAEALGGTALNAGVCGYGYAQMSILAGRLVPRHRPDIVLFQASPWLWQRAARPYAETYFGLTPVPYFARTSGGFELRRPRFRSWAIGIPVEAYRAGPASRGESLAFLCGPGSRLFVHDDLRALPYRLREWTLGAPRPPDRVAVLEEILRETAKTCAVQRARLLIVQIGVGEGPGEEQLVRGLPSALHVDATRALEERLTERTRGAYLRAYAHWRGDPPRLVDTHFNPAAHAVVADEILATLARAGGR